jgi:acylphosphatase
MIRKRVIVRGQVQGVGFRWSAQAEADRLGVAGYARNLPDGTVQAEIEGPEQAVQRMLEWLHHGPRHARVEALDVTDVDPTSNDLDNTPSGNRFMIR